MKTNTKLLSSYKKYVYKTAKKHFKNNNIRFYYNNILLTMQTVYCLSKKLLRSK